MNSTACTLNLDVFHVLLDTLIAQASDENNHGASMATLRECSLVHRSSRHHIQRHLFSTINLIAGTNGHCVKFYTLIKHSPRLSAYVKTLVVHLDLDPCVAETTSQFDNEEVANLVPIINTLHRIHFLRLFVRKGNLDFQKLPDNLQYALLNRFKTLDGIECRSFFNLPIQHIASCYQLKKLLVFTPRHIRRDETDEHLPTSLNLRHVASLEELHTDDETCLPYFTTDTCTYPLQSLAVERLPFRSVQPLLRLSQRTLRHLAVELVYDVPEYITSDMEFSSLETMKWTVKGSNNSTPPNELYYAASIVESGDNARRPLKSISFTLSDHYSTTTATVPSFHPWTQIDTALSHPRYHAFEMLSLTIFKSHYIYSTSRQIPFEVSSEGIKRDLVRWFPNLHGCHKVKVLVQLVPYLVPAWF